MSIDKRKKYYREYYQKNKDKYKERYTQQKLSLDTEQVDATFKNNKPLESECDII